MRHLGRFPPGEYQRYAAQLRREIHNVCCFAGVRAMWLGHYATFGLRVDKALRTLPHPDRVQYIPVLIEQWVKRGLDRRVLVRICREVFTLGIPRPDKSDAQAANPGN